MFKRINVFLAGWPMTIVGGLFLLASFILPRAGYPAGEKLAWVCVVICGIPLLYLSIWRVIHTRGIAFGPGETLETLYAHRTPIYQRWADITVHADPGSDLEQTVEQIAASLN